MVVVAVFYSAKDDASNSGEGTVDISHIHGIGIEPSDGALLIATHEGLIRSAKGTTSIARVGDVKDDLMGFFVLGPGRYIGSGHPSPDRAAPPNLGLLKSSNGGNSWQTVSLEGEADFHILRGSGSSVVGVSGHKPVLFTSTDLGDTWVEQKLPEGLADLMIDPENSKRVVASTARGLLVSDDLGKSWNPGAKAPAGLLAWDPDDGRFYLVDESGELSSTKDPASKLVPSGSLGELPAAITAADGSIYAALASGAVKVSTDGGKNWELRAGSE